MKQSVGSQLDNGTLQYMWEFAELRGKNRFESLSKAKRVISVIKYSFMEDEEKR